MNVPKVSNLGSAAEKAPAASFQRAVEPLSQCSRQVAPRCERTAPEYPGALVAMDDASLPVEQRGQTPKRVEATEGFLDELLHAFHLHQDASLADAASSLPGVARLRTSWCNWETGPIANPEFQTRQNRRREFRKSWDPRSNIELRHKPILKPGYAGRAPSGGGFSTGNCASTFCLLASCYASLICILHELDCGRRS